MPAMDGCLTIEWYLETSFCIHEDVRHYFKDAYVEESTQ